MIPKIANKLKKNLTSTLVLAWMQICTCIRQEPPSGFCRIQPGWETGEETQDSSSIQTKVGAAVRACGSQATAHRASWILRGRHSCSLAGTTSVATMGRWLSRDGVNHVGTAGGVCVWCSGGCAAAGVAEWGAGDWMGWGLGLDFAYIYSCRCWALVGWFELRVNLWYSGRVCRDRGRGMDSHPRPSPDGDSFSTN